MKTCSGNHLRVHCAVIDLACSIFSLSSWLGRRTGGIGWFWVEKPKLSCSSASDRMCGSHKPSSSSPFLWTYVPGVGSGGVGWWVALLCCLMIFTLLDLTVVSVSLNSVIPTIDARTVEEVV